MDWGSLRIEGPFLLYNFTTGRLSGLANVGPYYGHRID